VRPRAGEHHGRKYRARDRNSRPTRQTDCPAGGSITGPFTGVGL
jgi:hypothetical protein